jgi:lysophospholipase L1-like esterase
LVRRPVSALNFARVGATSRSALGIVAEASRLRPEAAIIEFAINDAALHRGVSLVESANNLRLMIQRLRSGGEHTRLYLMTMSPVVGLRRLLRPRLDRYYDLYPALAERERVGLIDNRPDWAALPRATLARALPDGSHPTAEFTVPIALANVVRALARDFAAD